MSISLAYLKCRAVIIGETECVSTDRIIESLALKNTTKIILVIQLSTYCGTERR